MTFASESGIKLIGTATLAALLVDHVQAEEARTMESLEIQILSRLGISDPYVDIS